MPVKGKKIVDWMQKELPPLSWEFVSVKLMKGFIAEGISPRAVTETTIFSDNLVKDIKQKISEEYKKDLPTF